MSIHKDSELREPPVDEQVAVKFGRKWHTGSIVSFGKQFNYNYTYSYVYKQLRKQFTW